MHNVYVGTNDKLDCCGMRRGVNFEWKPSRRSFKQRPATFCPFSFVCAFVCVCVCARALLLFISLCLSYSKEVRLHRTTKTQLKMYVEPVYMDVTQIMQSLSGKTRDDERSGWTGWGGKFAGGRKGRVVDILKRRLLRCVQGGSRYTQVRTFLYSHGSSISFIISSREERA